MPGEEEQQPRVRAITVAPHELLDRLLKLGMRRVLDLFDVLEPDLLERLCQRVELLRNGLERRPRRRRVIATVADQQRIAARVELLQRAVGADRRGNDRQGSGWTLRLEGERLRDNQQRDGERETP